MNRHLEGCLEDPSLDAIIVHHGAHDLKSDSALEDIATDVVNLAVSVKNEKTNVYTYISSSIIRNDKLDKKMKRSNEVH